MFIKLETGIVYDTDFTAKIAWDWNTDDNQIYYDNLVKALIEIYELKQKNVAGNCVRFLKSIYHPDGYEYCLFSLNNTKYKDEIQKYLILQ